MSARDRLPLLALLWLLTAAAAGFLFAWLLRPAATGESRIVYRDAVRGAEERVPGPGAPAGAPAGGPIEPAESPPRGDARPDAPAPGTGPSPAADRGPPPSILVTVLGLDGEPAEDGTVYALGAGEPGSDDEGGVFSTLVEGPEPVRLRLPLPGLYDIGFRDVWGATLLTDVRVEAGDGNEAVLRPAPRLPVQVRIEGEWPPPGVDRPELIVDFWTADDPRQLEFPGRGERGSAGGTAILTGSSGESVPLVQGRVYQCGVRVQELRTPLESPDRGQRERPQMLNSYRFASTADRESVRPGETLTVRIARRAAVALTPVLAAGLREAESSRNGGNRFVDVSILRDGREVASTSVGTLLHPPPNWIEPSVMMTLEPGTFEVRWEGSGVRSGARTGIAVAAGEMVEVGIPLEVDSTPPPPPAPAEPAVVEEAEPGEPPREILVEGAPPDGGVFLLGEFLDEDGRPHSFDTGIDLVEGASRWDAGEVREWVVAGTVVPPFLASEFQPVPAAGPLRLALRPAGLVLFVPTEVLPPELGSYRLRRADGRPIPMADRLGHEFEGAVMEWILDGYNLLGPFPEGRITFEVRLGGLRLPDLRADVKAGRIEVVRVSR